MKKEITTDDAPSFERIPLRWTLRDSALFFAGGVAAVAAGLAVFKYGVDDPEMFLPAIAASFVLESIGGGCLAMSIDVPVANHRQNIALLQA